MNNRKQTSLSDKFHARFEDTIGEYGTRKLYLKQGDDRVHIGEYRYVANMIFDIEVQLELNTGGGSMEELLLGCNDDMSPKVENDPSKNLHTISVDFDSEDDMIAWLLRREFEDIGNGKWVVMDSNRWDDI